VAAATSDYLVFLDGDCAPHQQFLADHEQLAERGFWCRAALLCGGAICAALRAGRHPRLAMDACGPHQGLAKGIRLAAAVIFRNKKQRGIIGCNMAYWREDVVAVNGFDEDCKGRGIGPDSDLGTRVYNLGRRRKFCLCPRHRLPLNHPILPRENLPAKRRQLAETIRTGKIRCEHGLHQQS